MATYSFRLWDFRQYWMNDRMPEVHFIPSGPATAGTTMFGSRTIVCSTGSGGDFQIDQYGECTLTLQPTKGMYPAAHFTMVFVWLNGAGVPIGHDSPTWKVNTTAAGGNIVDMIDAQAEPDHIFVGPTAPPSPALYTGWIDTTTSTYKEWE